jgi:hypothetical protein
MEFGKHIDYRRQERVIRYWIIFFMIALALSGITAFALETELRWMLGIWGDPDAGRVGGGGSGGHSGDGVYFWIQRVYEAIRDTNGRYPWLAYGYDWLAYAHLVIALAFIGPLRDPVRNIWIIEFGIIACIAVWPLAAIAGAVRGIPVYWRLIDCSFGVVGLIPLGICHRKIRVLERAQRHGWDERGPWGGWC